MITLKTIGQPRTPEQLASALQDLYQVLQQMVVSINALSGAAAAGQLVFPVVDADGTIASYRLVAGTGVTITPNTVTKTITITSP